MIFWTSKRRSENANLFNADLFNADLFNAVPFDNSSYR